MLVISPSGGAKFPSSNALYVMNSATDQTRMGGTAENVYAGSGSAQAVYDAANTLQVALGGSNKVYIYAGICTAAVVGNISLSAAYNQHVIWVGLGVGLSVLGTITVTGGNSLVIETYNIRFGNVTTTSSTTAGGAITHTGSSSQFGTLTSTSTWNNAAAAGGAISLTGNSVYTTLTTSATANAAGIGGSVTLSGIGQVSGITTTGGSAGTSGAVTASNGFRITGNILTSGGSTGGTGGAINITTNCTVTGSITCSSGSSSGDPGDLTLADCSVAAVTVVNNGSSSKIVSINNTKSSGNLSITMGGSSSISSFAFNNSIFNNATISITSSIASPQDFFLSRVFVNNLLTVSAGAATVEVFRFILVNCSIPNNNITVTNSSSSTGLAKLSIRNTTSGGVNPTGANEIENASVVVVLADDDTSTLEAYHDTVLIDATAGNITYTVQNDEDVFSIEKLTIKRIDNSSNTVTIAINDCDEFSGSYKLYAQHDGIRIIYGSPGKVIVESIFCTPSGVYSPTFTGVANVGSISGSEAQYMRVGNVVTVSGRFTLDPTAAVATTFGISLPIASNFGAAEDCAGTAFCGTIAGQGAEINADTTNDRANVTYIAVDITSQTWAYTFTYAII